MFQWGGRPGTQIQLHSLDPFDAISVCASSVQELARSQALDAQVPLLGSMVLDPRHRQLVFPALLGSSIALTYLSVSSTCSWPSLVED